MVRCKNACALLLGAVAGCTSLFDLQSAIPDRDLDGIADEDDNCPTDYNPEQRDSGGSELGDVCDCTISNRDADGDGVDDACDDCIGHASGVDSGGDGIDDGCEVCAAAIGQDVDKDGIDDACDPCEGPDHDEDGDGVPDACDDCPTQPDPDQEPALVGVLGAACNRLPATTTLFDPLVAQDPRLWPGAVPGWSWQDDALVGTDSVRAVLAQPGLSSVVETRVQTTGATESVALVCIAPDADASCTFDRASGQLVLTVVITGVGPAQFYSNQSGVIGTDQPRFQMRIDGEQSQTWCEALDANGEVLAGAMLTRVVGCARVQLRAIGQARFDYLWLAWFD